MTLENRKARYKFYIANGDTNRAADLASRYSDVVEKVKKVEKKSKKE